MLEQSSLFIETKNEVSFVRKYWNLLYLKTWTFFVLIPDLIRERWTYVIQFKPELPGVHISNSKIVYLILCVICIMHETEISTCSWCVESKCKVKTTWVVALPVKDYTGPSRLIVNTNASQYGEREKTKNRSKNSFFQIEKHKSSN